MPVSSDFVRELFAAANQIHLMSRLEAQRLIERAATTIDDQRERLAVSTNVVPLTQDLTADLPKLLANLDRIPPELLAVVLIRCADEITRLERLAQ
ncbi:hypothetical protein J2046_001747 [Rhizobium petrolearium]|uniref:hypothetical protein n=1 Tax=Neorhizobium petrolearium TaxID=515361 RepID=UPI001AE31658|nr:hypothetical protein [Neorhizobium petrolearium]MBP1843491.1 hypothetical protein [Neorhizobium petrolearium]